MEFIRGEDRNQTTMLPESVDEYVGENNPARVIDAYIDSLNLAELGFEKPEPNDTGRPMYSPKNLLKLYVYGYMNRIRSSRRLETETCKEKSRPEIKKSKIFSAYKKEYSKHGQKPREKKRSLPCEKSTMEYIRFIYTGW